ncbi:MAG TPA: ATP-dependent RecD-like DNA helicase, partial [Candidatus Binatia bacterium]|nr:ATP-dependent RecD-like DNA helicase [Candidatus Binatia bacterium]
IVLPCADGALRAHFLGTDGGVRTLPPGQLGSVDDALAITVHRAQGSELDRVAVVIDPLRLRGLSRALLYTAVTRARRAVQLFATPDTLAALG